jgi:hypothetical protein
MQGKVDYTALRVNQACIIVCLLLAFLLDWWWLVAAVAAIMLVGTLWPKAGLFKLFYGRVLRPAGLLQPDLVPDEQQPHLFAQGVGAIFLLVATLALLTGAQALGWILTGTVVALAAVNLFFGFCAGCFIYFQLARRGIHFSLPGWQ